VSVGGQGAPQGLIERLCEPDGVRFVRFLFAAGSSVPVNILVRIGLSRVLPYEAAVVLAHLAGMAVAFTTTKLLVFEPSGRAVGGEMARFALVNMVSLAQTWIIAVGLVRFVFPATGMTYAPELIGHVTGLATTAVTSFLLHRHFSFGRRRARVQAGGGGAPAAGDFSTSSTDIPQ
jgi:putative flippase GtrA